MFPFYKTKAKIAFSICFAAAVIEAVHTASSESGTTKLLPGELSLASQHLKPP